MRSICIFILVMTLFSCAEEKKLLGTEVINASISAHGEWETYQNLDHIAFLKTTKLFREDGSLELETKQQQSFRLKPSYLAGISWKTDTIDHLIVYDGMNASKLVNDEVLRNSEETKKALKTAKSADYVFFQPFKLKSDEVIATNLGHMVIMDSVNVSAVSIKYKNDDAASDQWTYYFDADNKLVANSVAHQDRISLIENLEFQEYKGLLFNKHRKSYFVDSLLNKKYLRAEYFYDLIPN